MAILTIDGVAIPDPSDMTVDRMDISSSETGRTQDGKMIKDIVSRKVKLNISYPTITWSACSQIITAIEKHIYLSVKYPDPKEGYVTKIMYVGDRSAPAVMIVDGKELWQGVAFNLIEQ